MDMAELNQWANAADSFVWGPVMLCLLVGTGIYMTHMEKSSLCSEEHFLEGV